MLGWVTLAAAAGVLTKGPFAMAFTGIPVLSAIVLRSERQTMHLTQLVLVLGLATLLVAPWFYLVARAITGSEGAWQNEWAGDDGPVFVMARLDPEGKAETWMVNRGFSAALDFDDEKRISGYGEAGCRLYQAR